MTMCCCFDVVNTPDIQASTKLYYGFFSEGLIVIFYNSCVQSKLEMGILELWLFIENDNKSSMPFISQPYHFHSRRMCVAINFLPTILQYNGYFLCSKENTNVSHFK